MRTAACLGSRLSVAVLLSMLVSCQAGTRLLDNEDPPPTPPDLAPPAPVCQKGSTRCAANRDATELCDGEAWQRQTPCDTKGGEQCVDSVCKSACDLVTRGNVGCSFYPVNLWSTSTVGKLGIVVTNTSDTLTANVKLEDANGTQYPLDVKPQTSLIPPGGVGIFRLDHATNKLNETEQSKKGFHLTSTTPVAVYQFHPIDAAAVFSGSATLLLPEHVMAKKYFIMSYTYNAALTTSPPQGQGSLTVVGLTDNTQVSITVPVVTKNGPGVPALKAGDTLKRTLNRLEALEIIQVNSLDDITGATVEASAPVVVYGGAGGVSIPSSAIGGNHLGVQMFPLETWGKRYLAAKVKQRNASDKDYFRIVASVDNTTFKLTGNGGLPLTLPKLMRGQFFEFSTASDFLIEADQPIMAFQFMPAWGNLTGTFNPADFPDGAPDNCTQFAGTSQDVKCLGDANITPLIPVEQFRSDYIFYVPATYKYQYLNVLAPIDATISIDGKQVTDAIKPITAEYGRFIVRITATGNHRITGNKPFGIIGYGYASFTSYSYAGGLNLDRINPVE